MNVVQDEAAACITVERYKAESTLALSITAASVLCKSGKAVINPNVGTLSPAPFAHIGSSLLRELLQDSTMFAQL